MINKDQLLSGSYKNTKGKKITQRGEGIHLTYQCNNNCVFCLNNHKRKTIKSMSLEEAKKEVIRLKSQGHKVISLQSNEPTIYPHIIPLIKFINKNNLEFVLATNARLFSYKPLVKQFVKAGLKGAYVSLHSHKAEVHDRLTRSLGSFNQTVNGIKNLLRHNVTVLTNIVILRQNVNDLEKIAEFFIDEFGKLHNARFSFLCDQGTGLDMLGWRKIMPSLSETRENLTKAMDIFRENDIYSFIEKMPVCGSPKYHLDFNPERDINEVNVKPKICSKCKYFNNDYCVGVSHTYLKLYGETDLIPQ